MDDVKLPGSYGHGVSPRKCVGGAYHSHRQPPDSESPAHVSTPYLIMTTTLRIARFL